MRFAACRNQEGHREDLFSIEGDGFMLQRTEDVVAMYSKYPYPSPTVGGTLAYDIANLFCLLCDRDDLNGRKILDAGCGTGQRVLGFAKRYPKAKFQRIDLTTASLEVAKQLAQRHNIQNIKFKKLCVQ